MIIVEGVEFPEQAMEVYGNYYNGKSYNLEIETNVCNIIETTTKELLGQLRRDEQGLWHNLPYHVYRRYISEVLNSYDLINNPTEFDNSLYSSLYIAFEYEDLSKYLYYISMAVAHFYNLDVNKSDVHLHEEGKIFIDGLRLEWVMIDDELHFESVIYLINIYEDATRFTIQKLFASEENEDSSIIVELSEFNKFILDEIDQ